ncbi:MAG TPA: hypothetical protein VFF36_12750, partial [Planctomycetota bacterium]|nr:hypothetical protein [Planctomycetota bacterium]
PPRTVSAQGTQLHTPALGVLLRVAGRAAPRAGVPVDPAFEGLLRHLSWEYHREDIELLVRALPDARREALLINSADRIDADLVGPLAGLLPADARERFLMTIAGAGDFRAVLAWAGGPAPRLLEVVAARAYDTLVSMENWAKDDIPDALERDAAMLAAAGAWAWPVLQRGSTDPARAAHPLYARALELLEDRCTFFAEVANGAPSRLDDRGLMPLDEARAVVRATAVFRRGDTEVIEGSGVTEADRVWAALLSLADAAEFVDHARRIDWRFHVRGTDNLTALHRYGPEIMPWFESRLRADGVLLNIPWCIVPCLLAIDSPAALELALRTTAVHELLPGQAPLGDGPGAFAVDEDSEARAAAHELPQIGAPQAWLTPTEGLDLARRWIAHHPDRYPLLARLAEAGNLRAAALLRDRAQTLGGAVLEGIEAALGPAEADRIAARFELPRSTLPDEVRALLAASEPVSEPRGPIWSIGELDEAAREFELPLWDNANYMTAAMRISGFASRHGDALIIESIEYDPGAGEQARWQMHAYGPGAGTRSASHLLVKPSELETVWLDDSDSIDGSSNLIRLWGERDADGKLIEDSEGRRVVPVPLPYEYLMVDIREVGGGKTGDRKVDYHLPRSFADLPEEARDELAQVTPAEAFLVSLCRNHQRDVFAHESDLARAAGLPEGAVHLFSFTSFEYPEAGEPVSSSIDLVAMAEAVRARRKLIRLP